MNTADYVKFLRRCYMGSAVEKDARREDMIRWGDLRSRQLQLPEISVAYKRQVNVDVGDAQTEYMNEAIVAPLMSVLNDAQRELLREVPIIVLPTRQVNACAAKAPSDKPIVIVDSGLLSMTDFYLELKYLFESVRKLHGVHEAGNYLLKSYKFILQYYRGGGELSFPEPDPDMVLPFEYKLDAICRTMAIETFAVAHELGHILAGHLEVASTARLNLSAENSVSAEFYQPSWEHEFEADRIGWRLYQQLWRSHKFLGHLAPTIGTTTPLVLFEYFTLIEINVEGVANRVSSHPPALLRLAKLLRVMEKEEDPEIFDFAIRQARVCFSMPNLDGNNHIPVPMAETPLLSISITDDLSIEDRQTFLALFAEDIAIQEVPRHALSPHLTMFFVFVKDTGVIASTTAALINLGIKIRAWNEGKKRTGTIAINQPGKETLRVLTTTNEKIQKWFSTPSPSTDEHNIER